MCFTELQVLIWTVTWMTFRVGVFIQDCGCSSVAKPLAKTLVVNKTNKLQDWKVDVTCPSWSPTAVFSSVTAASCKLHPLSVLVYHTRKTFAPQFAPFLPLCNRICRDQSWHMQNLKGSEILYFSALHFQVWKEPQNSPPHPRIWKEPSSKL